MNERGREEFLSAESVTLFRLKEFLSLFTTSEVFVLGL
jgi:hypothetical protein